ncbi:MAG: hypothetical protein ABI162_00840 [Luteolibacter sp.]
MEKHRSGIEPSDDELREMLDAAERRKEADWSQKGRKISWIVLVPTGAAILWAVCFLIQYKANEKPEEIKQPVVLAPTAAETDAQNDMAPFDLFKPESQHVGNTGKSAEPQKPEWKMVDKGDIEFAMQLLNFVQPPASAKPKKD